MRLGIKSPGTCAQVFCHFLGELESKPAAFKSQGCVYEGRTLQLLQNLLMKISCPFLYLGELLALAQYTYFENIEGEIAVINKW